ncbi:hypothetical protein A6D6_01894 [Alcanivorax xiamenensis]|uniref:Uncharacterized protein n=1 Tax=Alcanivorax xiamenensis TaxID=1177156 RepID=A0ABQ6Y8V8_9GAMM|nr:MULTISPECIES: hypothetical protein [Alcanivorax]KAF0806076.1 hypothetical protein A6D6_01894 [Alcanivorax xiamenensis]
MGHVEMEMTVSNGGMALAAFLIGVVLVVSGYILLWSMEWLEDLYLIRRESRSQTPSAGRDDAPTVPPGDNAVVKAGSEVAGKAESKVTDG